MAPETVILGRAGDALTALTVLSPEPNAPLSPFFAKAPWVALLEPTSKSIDHFCNEGWTSAWMCDRLATAGVSRLICGFIDRAGHDALVASGVDVRVGACRGPALQLVACFYELPKLFS